jgi:hypothetical protein
VFSVFHTHDITFGPPVKTAWKGIASKSLLKLGFADLQQWEREVLPSPATFSYHLVLGLGTS